MEITRTHSTDADAERIIDRRVQRRLATDAAYRNAANADEQAEREDEITRQEEDRFYSGSPAA